MEACGGSHHWGRRLRELGHEIRLLPAARVRPFASGNKNDVHDARAICTAARQPGIRPVPVKSAEQQAVLGLHRARQQLVKFRTAQINGLRGTLAEFGEAMPQRRPGLRAGIAVALDEVSGQVPEALTETLREQWERVAQLDAEIRTIECAGIRRRRPDPDRPALRGGILAPTRRIPLQRQRATLIYLMNKEFAMEPGAATVAAAAAAAAPDVVTILGVMLNTDQLIAATHAAISLIQTGVVVVGIWFMVSANKSRSADYDKRHQQAMAAHRQTMAAHRQAMTDRKQRHDEAMAAHRRSMADQKQRHDEAMKAMDKRHEESMAAQRASMTALEELIRRTAPPPAGG